MVTPLQTQSSSQKAKPDLRRLPVYLTAFAGILLVIMFVLLSKEPEPTPTTGESAQIQTTSGEIVEGASGGVAYYHCGGQDAEPLDVVLLHGAAFTKENWKNKGILDKLCSSFKLSVTALDLANGSKHKDLQNVLDALRKDKLIRDNKPVALVTPSLSGSNIVDWITNGDVDTMIKYVGYWIPVAAGSVSKASEASLKGLKGKLPILAIYGSKDKGGKETSERLKSLSDAKMVEVEGGHPCYLDSPDSFVRELKSFLSV